MDVARPTTTPSGPDASMVQAPLPPPPELQRLQSPWVFRCCWFAVLAMHIVIGLAYFAMALLFGYIKANVNVREAMAYLGGSPLDYFPAVIGVGSLIAVLHALAILYLLFWSVRYQTLLFSCPESDAPAAQQQQASTRFWARLCSTRSTPMTAGGGAAGSHATESRSFSILGLKTHDLELLVDIALQTFQAEKISRLIARVWINRLVALVIVGNCWFVPLVRLAFRKQHRATVEIIQLVVDSTFDIVYAIAVPAAILFPYYHEFDVEHQTFPFLNYYMDAWYINAVAENRQFFITSAVDFISKMLPGLSLLLRLHQIKCILMTHKQFGVKKIKPSGGATAATTASVQTTDKRHTVARWLHSLVLLGWGIAVLTLHIHATTVAHLGHDPGCLLELRPWAATKYVCVVLEVSCTQKHIDGTRAQVDAVFAAVDVPMIQGLVLSHCPALDVPPTLQRATKLQMLKVHNTTIASWGADAALTATAHPHMQLLYVTRTNMSGMIPLGLRSPDFPPTLYDVEFCDTDLTALPLDVHEAWSNVEYLLLELSPGITEAPPVLALMPNCIWLSLSSNAIRRIPNNLFEDAAFFNLMLMGNPLVAMPATLGDIEDTSVVVISNTNVSALPPRLLASTGSAVPLYASETPLCDNWLSTQDASAPMQFDAGPFRVDCDSSNAITHMYPLDWEDYWRKANHH